MSINENAIGRRSLLRRGATAAGLGLLADLEAYPQNVNRNSLPSDLKVTDVRIAVLRGPQGQAGGAPAGGAPAGGGRGPSGAAGARVGRGGVGGGPGGGGAGGRRPGGRAGRGGPLLSAAP